MAKKRNRFKCTNCGAITTKEVDHCLKCGTIDCMELIIEENSEPINKKNSYIKANKRAVRLKDVDSSSEKRLITNVKEFDRVMGGGVVDSSISIISARPGTGKTTLLLEVSNELAKQGYNTLYATGEEDEGQLKITANRIIDIHENLYIVDNSNLDTVLEDVEKLNIDFFVIDSIHKFWLTDFSESNAGSSTQLKQCFEAIRSVCKGNENKKIACMMIGQVTKEDEIRGTNELLHDVDTILELSKETNESDLRFVRSNKNRFGGIETGIFQMTDKGMISLDNPAEYFVSHRQKDVEISGVSLSVIIDGTRPLIVEIESLASPSINMFPNRITTCMKKDSLNILLSILEQRASVNEVSSNNIIVNTTAGIQLKERSCDLAIIMSVWSSLKNFCIPNDLVYISEVGLTGELKCVPSIERRLKEIERMGYKKAIISSYENIDIDKFETLEIIKCKNLLQVKNKTMN